jgi:hypothetical protein
MAHHVKMQHGVSKKQKTTTLKRNTMFSKIPKNMNKQYEHEEEMDSDMEITDEDMRYLDNPIYPDTTNAYIIEHNIRYKNGEKKRVRVIDGGNNAKEELMNNGICHRDICLMAYDIQGLCNDTEQELIYDRIVVRSEKPLEYWKERFN